MKDNAPAIQRGRGKRSRLSKTELAALDTLFEQHGYEPINADGLVLDRVVVGCLALIGGELATVLLGDDERWHAIRLLEASGDAILESIARQLRTAAEREAQNAAE